MHTHTPVVNLYYITAAGTCLVVLLTNPVHGLLTLIIFYLFYYYYFYIIYNKYEHFMAAPVFGLFFGWLATILTSILKVTVYTLSLPIYSFVCPFIQRVSTLLRLTVVSRHPVCIADVRRTSLSVLSGRTLTRHYRLWRADHIIYIFLCWLLFSVKA